MLTSVSTYSFTQYIKAGKMTQFDAVAKAKEMGFDGVELTEMSPHDGSSQQEYAKKIKEESNKLNFPLVSYTFGANFVGCEDIEEEINRVKKQIDIAEILGVKVIRHDAAYYAGDKFRTFDQALPQIAYACKELTQYAQAKGIKTTVENHGYFCQDSDRVERLVNAVNHPNFGLLVDMGNFTFADEDPVLAVSRVAPYAFHAHTKDFHIKSAMEVNPGRGYDYRSRSGKYIRGAIVGHGIVPVKHCLQALKRANYDGFVSIEFEGIEDCILGIEIGLENLKRYISELE